MEMLKFQVSNNTIRIVHRPQIITSGTVGLPVEFSFDASWDGLARLTVFKAGSVTITVKDPKVVPWEVLEKTDVTLQVGVYGVNAEGTIVIPTVWASVRMIAEGVDPEGDPAVDPTLPVWQDVLFRVEALEESGGGSGEPGKDGYSPIANVMQTPGGAVITITDKNGTTTATVANGKDGFSPIVSVDSTEDGHEITIEDAGGTHSVFVENGNTPYISVYEVEGGYNIDITSPTTGNERIFIKDGVDGYTPVRGTDYWTEADHAQIVADVIASLPVYNGEIVEVSE